MPTPSPTPAPLPTADPPPPGTLRVGVVGAAPHLDLHRLVSEWATLFGPSLAYSRLLRFETGPGVVLPSMSVECDLCDEWRVVDPLTYEFDIHPGARWQDATDFVSQPATPQDVVFSLERLRTEGYPHVSLLDAVREIEPVGTRTVRLRLRYPDPGLPQKLASPNAVIISPGALSGHNLHTDRVVGSGPWRFTQGASGQVNLVPWEGYFRPGLPASEGITFLPVRDLETGVALLRRGTVDMAQVTEAQWDVLGRQGFRSMEVRRQGSGLVFIVNARRPPLDDAGVRRAVFLGLDPHAALDEAFDDAGWVGVGVPVVEPSWLLDDDTLRAAFGDPAGAARLLTGAGLASPEVTLTVANFGEAYVAHGELLARQLRIAGFDVTVEIVSRSSYLTKVWEERDFDLAVGPLPPVSTTNSFLLSIVHSEGQRSVTGHANGELDALIEAQSAEADPTRRGELVQEAQAMLLTEALLFMPRIATERWAYNDRVEGFFPNMAAGSGDFWARVRVAR